MHPLYYYCTDWRLYCAAGSFINSWTIVTASVDDAEPAVVSLGATCAADRDGASGGAELTTVVAAGFEQDTTPNNTTPAPTNDTNAPVTTELESVTGYSTFRISYDAPTNVPLSLRVSC